MGTLDRVFSAGKFGKVRVQQIDKGLGQIQNVIKSLQVDRSYVKAGLLGSKASKPRPKVKRIEINAGNVRVKDALRMAGHDHSHLVLLGLLAAKSEQLRNAKTPTNVELGIIHELGTKKVPKRPFVRPAFEKNRADYLAMLELLVRESVYLGHMRIDQALGIIGAKMAADMKLYVTTGPQIPPPNQGYPDRGYWLEKVMRGQAWQDKARARRLKRGLPVKEGPYAPPRTLVDTGRMIGSITWAVIHKSSGEREAAP